MNKQKFLDTTFGFELKTMVKLWDKALEMRKESAPYSEEFEQAQALINRYSDQWEIFQLAAREFRGLDLHFSRTDEYFGVTIGEKGDDYLFWVLRATGEVQT